MQLTLPLWEKSKAAFSADMTLLMRKSQQSGYRYRRGRVGHVSVCVEMSTRGRMRSGREEAR